MTKWELLEIRFNSSNEIHIYATCPLDLAWLSGLVPKTQISDSASEPELGVWRYLINAAKDITKISTWAIMARAAQQGWDLVSRSDDYYATYMFKRKIS